MADEAKTPVALDATKQSEESTRLAGAPADITAAEAKPAEGGEAPPSNEDAEGLCLSLSITRACH
jgi:hypothetical protein